MCSVGGGADERAEAIAIDSSGNSYMVGRFNSNFIGSGNSALNRVGASAQDIFAIKFDNNGAPVWAKK